MANKQPTAAERIKALAEGKKAAAGYTPSQIARGDHRKDAVEPQKTPKAKKALNETDRRKFNKRDPKSGRQPSDDTLVKRGVQQWLDEHINEQVDVQFEDKRTGKIVKKKMPRLMMEMEVLYKLGIGATVNGNVAAITQWLDRALGKPMQPLEHRGDKDAPLRIVVDL